MERRSFIKASGIGILGLTIMPELLIAKKVSAWVTNYDINSMYMHTMVPLDVVKPSDEFMITSKKVISTLIDMKQPMPHMNYYLSVGDVEYSKNEIPTVHQSVDSVFIESPKDYHKVSMRPDFERFIDKRLNEILPLKDTDYKGTI